MGASERESTAIREAWARHLEQFEWTHFGTLTTRLPHSPTELRREFERGYVRRLARAAQGPVPWFYIVERGTAGLAHVHALLANTGTLRLDQLRRAWLLGHTHVVAYDAARDAAFYLTKQMVPSVGANHDAAEYDISRRLPRRRAA